jgi:hypothetical protein
MASTTEDPTPEAPPVEEPVSQIGFKKPRVSNP